MATSWDYNEFMLGQAHLLPGVQQSLYTITQAHLVPGGRTLISETKQLYSDWQQIKKRHYRHK